MADAPDADVHVTRSRARALSSEMRSRIASSAPSHNIFIEAMLMYNFIKTLFFYIIILTNDKILDIGKALF